MVQVLSVHLYPGFSVYFSLHQTYFTPPTTGGKDYCATCHFHFNIMTMQEIKVEGGGLSIYKL